MAACELTWSPAGEEHLALPPRLARELGPLVGRQAEFDALRTAWRECATGTRGVVMVAGEPGIGKTRLVAELCREAHEEGATVLFGAATRTRSCPTSRSSRRCGHYVSACPADELNVQLGPRRGVLARIVPELGTASEGTRGGSRDGDPRASVSLSSTQSASLLGEIAGTRPAILVLDDLHWADPPRCCSCATSPGPRRTCRC